MTTNQTNPKAQPKAQPKGSPKGQPTQQKKGAQPASAKSKGASPKTKGKGGQAPLPVFLETVYGLSFYLLIMVDLAVAGVSYFAGAKMTDILLRVGLTTLVMGAILAAFAWRVMVGAVQTMEAVQDDAKKQAQTKTQANQTPQMVREG